MASEAARGQAALQVSDYPLAIKHFTAALKDSQSPLWLIQRSTAYQRTQQHEYVDQISPSFLLTGVANKAIV